MSTVESYLQGTPAWVDLLATDRKAAADFYGGLFAWKFRDVSGDTGDYALALLDGDPVAGIGEKPEAEPFSAMWTTYFAVTNADSAAIRISAAGGLLSMDPIVVTDGVTRLGRLSIAADPAGAIFGVWEAGSQPGAVRINEPGSLAWSEAMSHNATVVRRFYRAVFNWGYDQIGDGVTFDYTTASVAGRAVCGVMQIPQGTQAQLTSHWLTYFAVADTDAAAERVLELGGEVVSEPRDSQHGRFSLVQDPQGAMFAAIQLPPGAGD